MNIISKKYIVSFLALILMQSQIFSFDWWQPVQTVPEKTTLEKLTEKASDMTSGIMKHLTPMKVLCASAVCGYGYFWFTHWRDMVYRPKKFVAKSDDLVLANWRKKRQSAGIQNDYWKKPHDIIDNTDKVLKQLKADLKSKRIKRYGKILKFKTILDEITGEQEILKLKIKKLKGSTDLLSRIVVACDESKKLDINNLDRVCHRALNLEVLSNKHLRELKSQLFKKKKSKSTRSSSNKKNNDSLLNSINGGYRQFRNKLSNILSYFVHQHPSSWFYKIRIAPWKRSTEQNLWKLFVRYQRLKALKNIVPAEACSANEDHRYLQEMVDQLDILLDNNKDVKERSLATGNFLTITKKIRTKPEKLTKWEKKLKEIYAKFINASQKKKPSPNTYSKEICDIRREIENEINN